MTGVLDHIAGQTFHGRKGPVRNAFTYGVDYLLVEPEAELGTPAFFARNRAALSALHDRDHGGPPGRGRGATWAREVLAAHGLASVAAGRLLLLAQPRVLGHVFNPVSFWLAHDEGERLRAVIAEVTNTFGDRHAYLCHRDDLGPIGGADVLQSRKLLHVSPFQPVEGGYRFRFDIGARRVAVRIDYRTGEGGVYATLTGWRRPLTGRAVLAMCLRRPFGSRRVLALIHWQALKLWWKGAQYRPRPLPPGDDVSR